jgi:hypothetical protein
LIVLQQFLIYASCDSSASHALFAFFPFDIEVMLALPLPHTPRTPTTTATIIYYLFPSRPLEEVYVGELLHFFDVSCLHNLLVIKKNPVRGGFTGDLLSDESYIMPINTVNSMINMDG